MGLFILFMHLPKDNVFIVARDMVKSDHDSYVHDGGVANLVLTERSLTCHYASLLRLRSLVVLL